MLLSIIIPLYNQEKYLNQALDSLMVQTIQDAEFLILDDGSSDKSAEIAQEYVKKDSRFKYFKFSNGGYGVRCNSGLDIAVGKYLMIFEPDDYYIDSKICEKVVNYLEKTSCDFVRFIPLVEGDTLDNFYNLDGKIKEGQLEIAQLYLHLPPSIWAACYNHDFIKHNNICFYETPGASYQDAFFTDHLFSCAKKIGTMNIRGIFYRTGHDGASSTISNRITKLSYFLSQIAMYYSNPKNIRFDCMNIAILRQKRGALNWISEGGIDKLSYGEYVKNFNYLKSLPMAIYLSLCGSENNYKNILLRLLFSHTIYNEAKFNNIKKYSKNKYIYKFMRKLGRV
jgi:glycosyltransferase involved in cell wall biosynthesis